MLLRAHFNIVLPCMYWCSMCFLSFICEMFFHKAREHLANRGHHVKIVVLTMTCKFFAALNLYSLVVIVCVSYLNQRRLQSPRGPKRKSYIRFLDVRRNLQIFKVIHKHNGRLTKIYRFYSHSYNSSTFFLYFAVLNSIITQE
jgi:hypothetical protein